MRKRRLILDGRSGFNPSTNLTGLRLWLEMDTITGVADGAGVSAWPDWSADARSVVQATGSLQPLYKVSIFGSRAGVLFDATDDLLTSDAMGSLLSGEDLAYSAFVVAKQLGVATNQCFWSFGRSSSANPTINLQTTSAGNYTSQRRDDANVNSGPSAAGADTSAHLLSVVCTGTTVSLWEDRVSILSGSAQNVGVCTIDRFTLGCRRRNVNDLFLNGYLGAVLFYDTALATNDRLQVESYLAGRYGISLA